MMIAHFGKFEAPFGSFWCWLVWPNMGPSFKSCHAILITVLVVKMTTWPQQKKENIQQQQKFCGFSHVRMKVQKAAHHAGQTRSDTSSLLISLSCQWIMAGGRKPVQMAFSQEFHLYRHHPSWRHTVVFLTHYWIWLGPKKARIQKFGHVAQMVFYQMNWMGMNYKPNRHAKC